MEALGPALGAAPYSPPSCTRVALLRDRRVRSRSWSGGVQPTGGLQRLKSQGLLVLHPCPVGGGYRFLHWAHRRSRAGHSRLQAHLCPAVLLTLSVKLTYQQVQVEIHMPLTCTAFIVPGLQPLGLSCPFTLIHSTRAYTHVCTHTHLYTTCPQILIPDVFTYTLTLIHTHIHTYILTLTYNTHIHT